jgi:hypothetical protein
MGAGRDPSGGEGVRRALPVVPAFVLTIVIGAMALVPAVRAEGCPNEPIRKEQVYGSQLPDCRAYEQVSPVDKNLTDAAGEPGIVQAGTSGDAVSYFAVAPFPGTAGSGGQAPTYLSTRSPGEEWLTGGLLPEASPGSHDQVVGLTEDLARTIVLAEEPSLAPGAATGPGARNAYVEDNATGSYQLLAPNIGLAKLSFAAATPGGARIIFETKALLPTANVAPAPGVTNLYEWNEAKPPGEQISLAGVLPTGKAPSGGSVAGPGGPAIGSPEPGGSADEFYTQNTISENGARIFFSDVETGIIYMREPETERTVQLSAGIKPAYWRATTPSGSFVFYTEGENLYRFNVTQFETSQEPEAEALAEARESLTSGAAGVQGTLGVSGDGSYAYFVATSKLAYNQNGNGEEAETGSDNFYEWHEELATHAATTTFIARLLGSISGETRDEPDWRAYNKGAAEGSGPSGGEKSSRVAPDGRTVLFSSISQLTSYDNDGKIEFYLYDAERPLSSGNPVCVSCNPSRSPAVSGAHLTSSNLDLTASPSPRNAFLTHNLSNEGGRVFFQTEEALVPGDKNNQLDVYEWEREGTGSCERGGAGFSERNDGCLYLISTGKSAQPSYFGDASADGNDVFFFTRQSLVTQDQDLNVDVYDARVDGGIAAQNPLPSAEPCTGETCRGPLDLSPVFGVPSSATPTGNDNLTPLTPRPAPGPKIKQKKKGKKKRKRGSKKGSGTKKKGDRPKRRPERSGLRGVVERHGGDRS